MFFFFSFFLSKYNHCGKYLLRVQYIPFFLFLYNPRWYDFRLRNNGVYYFFLFFTLKKDDSTFFFIIIIIMIPLFSSSSIFFVSLSMQCVCCMHFLRFRQQSGIRQGVEEPSARVPSTRNCARGKKSTRVFPFLFLFFFLYLSFSCLFLCFCFFFSFFFRHLCICIYIFFYLLLYISLYISISYSWLNLYSCLFFVVFVFSFPFF